MIFVPCRDGRSHTPDEWAENDDIALGAAVLFEAVRRLDTDLTGEALMGRILTEKDVEAAVKGGSVYAAGGGGWADHGRMLGYAAVSVGKPELVAIDELEADDWVATAAAIGAPASTTPWEMRGVDYVKAVQLLQEALGEKLVGPDHRAERQVARRSTAGCRRPSSAPRWSTRSAISAPIRPATWARSAWPVRPSR